MQKYFKEMLIGERINQARKGMKPNKLINPTNPFTKLIDYCKSSKTRFKDKTTEHFLIDKKYDSEIEI